MTPACAGRANNTAPPRAEADSTTLCRRASARRRVLIAADRAISRPTMEVGLSVRARTVPLSRVAVEPLKPRGCCFQHLRGREEVRPAQLVSPPGAAGRFLKPSSRGHAPDPLTILTPPGLTLPRCERQRVYKRPALVPPFVLGPHQGPDQTERCSTRRPHGYDRFPRRPCRRTGPACALLAEALLHNTPLPNRKGAEAVKLSRARHPLPGSTTRGTNRLTTVATPEAVPSTSKGRDDARPMARFTLRPHLL